MIFKSNDKIRMCRGGALRDPSYDKPTPLLEDLIGFITMIGIGMILVFITSLFNNG